MGQFEPKLARKNKLTVDKLAFIRYTIRMHTDKLGQIIFNENDLLDLYLTNPDILLKNVLVDRAIKFDPSLSLENIPNLIPYEEIDKSVEVFDQECQNNWYLPDNYKDFDIAKFVLTQCNTEEELQRAGKELLLYQERNMFPLLCYLKYLVDTMRSHNIVWGVGRGSSVSSFVPFLIGVHKINSLYYELDIDEFLKQTAI